MAHGNSTELLLPWRAWSMYLWIEDARLYTLEDFEAMKKAADLMGEWARLRGKRMPRAEKEIIARQIRGGVSDIEKAAVQNPAAVSYYEIGAARRVLVLIDDWLGK